MTAVFKAIGVALAALSLWWLSLVLIGLAIRLTYLGLMVGWRLV